MWEERDSNPRTPKGADLQSAAIATMRPSQIVEIKTGISTNQLNLFILRISLDSTKVLQESKAPYYNGVGLFPLINLSITD